MIELLAKLIIGHAIADYPLQGDFLSRAKNRDMPLPGVPWYQAMSAHAVMHGGMVWALTGSLYLGVAEMIAHVVIDDAKCTGKIGFNTDQALHIMCKVAWVSLATL